MADEPKTEETEDSQRRVVRQLEVEDANAITAYANFCRVTGAFEELLIDFGLNPQAPGAENLKPVRIDQRIVVNYWTAKRLAAALQMSIARHENLFGVLETDIQKRVRRPNEEKK